MTQDNFDLLKKITYKCSIKQKETATVVEEIKTTEAKLFRTNKKTFKRFLKYKWLKLKRKIRHKKDVDLSKNLTFIFIVLIVAFSYIFVEQGKINYKEKIRQEEELRNKIQQEAYEDCMKDARTNYSYNWDRACKSLKRKNDCLLPAYRADSIEKWRNEEETNCLNKLKNKAFKEYRLEE